jgi:hypothetical protein
VKNGARTAQVKEPTPKEQKLESTPSTLERFVVGVQVKFGLKRMTLRFEVANSNP